jgi:hypothetical protein
MGDKIFAIEVVHVNLNLTGHTFTGHRLSSISKELEIFNPTNGFKALHDALAN